VIDHRRLIGLSVLLICMGCADDGKPPMAKVEGTVSYKGKLLANCAISFIPTNSGLRTGVGKTDEAGKFVLGSYDANDGSPVGECKVVFSLRGPSKPPKNVPKWISKEALQELYELGDPLIPAKYFQPEKTDIIVTVEKGKLNTFQFELKD